MRTQRKIHHLLTNNGKMSRNFRYLPVMNPVHTFDFTKTLYLTDKIDGTTVQVKNNVLYKRMDRFKKGDPRKFTATEEERYTLMELDTTAPQWKWIMDACKPYRLFFAKLPSYLAVYFEAFGDKIQSRFKGLSRDIRVFDTAIEDNFNYFWFTVQICKNYKLSHVNCFRGIVNGIDAIINWLSYAVYWDKTLLEYEVEGWVIRQKDQIAKIRKSDLKKIEWKEKL